MYSADLRLSQTVNGIHYHYFRDGLIQKSRSILFSFVFFEKCLHLIWKLGSEKLASNRKTQLLIGYWEDTVDSLCWLYGVNDRFCFNGSGILSGPKYRPRSYGSRDHGSSPMVHIVWTVNFSEKIADPFTKVWILSGLVRFNEISFHVNFLPFQWLKVFEFCFDQFHFRRLKILR